MKEKTSGLKTLLHMGNCYGNGNLFMTHQLLSVKDKFTKSF